MARESKRKRDEKRFGKPERLVDMIPRGVDGWDGVPIEATNINDYYINFIDTHDGLDLARDIPCVRLPFPEVFIEMLRSNIGGMRVGWRLFNIGPDNELARDSWDANQEKDDYGRGWTDAVSGIAFLATRSVATKPIGLCVYHMDAAGQLACNPSFKATDEFRSLCLLRGIDCGFFLQDSLIPTLLALSFMHCKNVTVDSVDPPKEVNRERKKHGLKPFVRFHTINIEPMKKVLRTEGNIEVNGLKKALHIVRGHFSTYSEERPLFGKVAGTFWVPAHTRGEIKQGIVVSDYNVKAPANP